MTTDWQFAQTITGRINFPQIWDANGLLISITNLTTPAWRKIGYLKIEALIEGEFFTAEYRTIEFGNNLIRIPFNEYRVSFEPIDKILLLHPNLQIKIAQLSLNMYVNNPETPRPQVGDPIYTTVTPAQPTATPAVFTIAPVRERRSVLITNRTSRAVRIKEGAAASLPTLIVGDPFVQIAAGGNYAVEDFSGEIVGLMEASYTATGRIYVKELPYIV